MNRRLLILIGLAALAAGLAAWLRLGEATKLSGESKAIEADDCDWWPSSVSTMPSTADAAQVLSKHCLTCHDSKTARGGIDLTTIDAAVKLKAAAAIRSQAMPPPERTRLNQNEITILDSYFEMASPRVTVRRLNRSEYDNTLRDLLGIDLHLANDFPADDSGGGFDNNASVLSLPPIMIEKYLAAAERAVDAAFQSPELRNRVLNLPPSAVPVALRKITLPVRDHVRSRLILSRADLPPDDPIENERQRAYTILMAFMDRAYRRPATHDEIIRLLRFVEESQRNGEGIEPGLRVAFPAILSSSQFLFRIERDPKRLDDFELATRLSYFLWSSTPDDELFHAAATGTLRHEWAKQVRRMLRDPKASALAANFAGQWLQTRSLNDFTPDAARFPQFDEALRQAMARETELFVDHVIREDRSVFDFLNADYTFVNERLAKHYGITNVQGDEFRRVSLTGTSRGGVFTQASILAITSNPTRTSPVKRGRWILENLLGAAPPSPPPGSDQLSESQTAGRTMRQQMVRHRSQPQCASCHAGMDPLGFGLESFDAIGAERIMDASGVLPDGTGFDGPAGLRTILLERRGEFEKCLAEKLFTYALGRGLDSKDRRAVNGIVRKLADHEDRFSALVLAIVHSEPFFGVKP